MLDRVQTPLIRQAIKDTGAGEVVASIVGATIHTLHTIAISPGRPAVTTTTTAATTTTTI
jgi:hypothetical protein